MLAVVVVNASGNADVTSVKDIYPKGFATTLIRFPGGFFDPPPNFANFAKSVDSYALLALLSKPAGVCPCIAGDGRSHFVPAPTVSSGSDIPFARFCITDR